MSLTVMGGKANADSYDQLEQKYGVLRRCLSKLDGYPMLWMSIEMVLRTHIVDAVAQQPYNIK